MISSLATFQKGLWSTWLGSGPQRSASLAKDTHTQGYTLTYMNPNLVLRVISQFHDT